MVLRAVASPSSAASAISACRPCPKTGHFGVPTSGKLVSVPQNRAFWGPELRKTHLRTPKTAILGSRTWKNAPPCPKTGHFGFPDLEKLASVPQKQPFWDPEPGKSRLRWAKQAFLPIRRRKSGLWLGKTGTFAHQRAGKAEPDSRKWRVWAGGMSLRGAQGIQGVTQGVGLKIFLREM